MTYVIVDIQTNTTVGEPYTNRNRARARADKLDMEYGAHRYQAIPIELYTA